jgi:protein tyrosine/serine phosphatase
MFAADLTTSRGRAKAWSHSLLADHAFFRVLWNNFAVVEPGRLYRSNHPTPGQLAAAARRHGIRTVINLRGPRRCGSDALSRDAAARLSLTHIDMALESRGAPHRERILQLAEIFRTMTPPALIHCKSGADRAGLAAGLFVVINGGSARDALAQLSWRFGHVKKSRTGILDAFFLYYAATGERLGKNFLEWVREDYDEQALRRDFRTGGFAGFLNDRILGRE